jgi:hypothetical protein
MGAVIALPSRPFVVGQGMMLSSLTLSVNSPVRLCVSGTRRYIMDFQPTVVVVVVVVVLSLREQARGIFFDVFIPQQLAPRLSSTDSSGGY